MTATSKAVVFSGPGQPLCLVELPLPSLAPGEVLVEVHCCTLCGSDLHTYHGCRSTPCPTVLGHEMLGRVVSLPSEPVPDHTGEPLRLGHRVVWSVMASCGDCFFCARGLPQKCERLFKYGHEPLGAGHDLSGGLAEHCHLKKGTAILRVPDALPDTVACPAGCATATVAGAFRVAGDGLGGVVLVQGAGALGLTACALARERGAAEVIACDVSPERLEMARRFGATRTALPGEDLAQAVRSASAGRGADLGFEMCGSPSAAEQGIDLLRVGGTYVIVGAVFPGRPVSLSAETIVRRLLTIRGSHNYAPADLADALHFLASAHGRYPFAELVIAEMPLEQAAEAFRLAATGYRVAVRPRRS